MTFYNHIEDARYEMFRLVNGWTSEGAETKARISESLDNARSEYMQKESENTKLRDLVELMLSCPMDKGDCDRCRQLNDLCEVEVLAGELGIEVG